MGVKKQAGYFSCAAALLVALRAPAASIRVPAQYASGTDQLPGEPENLPYGVFPSLNTVQDTPRETEDLPTQIKDLTKRVSSTVKTFASRRNFTCLGDPCLIQAFPLLYNSRGSGFFGGFRANVQNITRTNPNLYSLDTYFVRSDTKQWLSFVALDFPKIESLPLAPRWKLRGAYSRTTETRYFGIGRDAQANAGRPYNELQYALKETGFQTTAIFPVAKVDNQRVSVFGLFSTIHHKPSRMSPNIPSKLFEDNPLGAAQGGISARMGLGVQIDSRDRELLTRTGWSQELSIEAAPRFLSDYRFYRASFIDRHYFSAGRYTLGLRASADALFAKVPFWELPTIGGIDPIGDVSGTDALRSYAGGRFHERRKFIVSIDNRLHLRARRVFGQLAEVSVVPLGVDLGRLGEQNAWSVMAGANFLFNRSFMVRTMTGWAPTGYALRLAFGQEF